MASLVLGAYQLAFASDKGPEGIGVLLDVSGSMKSLVNADDTKKMLKSLLLKSKRPVSWNLSSSQKGDWLVDRLTDDDSGPLLTRDDQFLLMKFGELMYPAFPFFEPPLKVDYEAPGQVSEIIDAMVPQKMTQQWTYITVGLAAASEMFSSQGKTRWYLLVLSDFDTDRNDKKPEGTPEQRVFEDQWKVGEKFNHEVVAVLRKNDTPSIQLQVVRVSRVAPPPEPPRRKLRLSFPESNCCRPPAPSRDPGPPSPGQA